MKEHASGPLVSSAEKTDSRGVLALLLVMACLAVIPRLVEAARQAVDFNGLWHVFIARNLTREWRKLAHPPLFPILLKATLAFGHTFWVYRSISIVSGAASVYLVGRVLLKLNVRRETALLGAAAMALAANSVNISITVESYALCVAFILWSFLYYLELVLPQPSAPVKRIAFAVLSTLAVATHYFAGLYLVACVAAPFVAAAVGPAYRRALVRVIPGRWKADALTLLPPAILGFLLYELTAKAWLNTHKGLPAFYFARRSESWISFMVRNLRNTADLLMPVTLAPARLALTALALFLLVALLTVLTERRSDPRRLMPGIFVLILILAGAVLGTLRLYPFGGAMRHQYLIFLFGLLAAFVVFDRAFRLLRTPAARLAAVFLCFAASAFSVFGWRPPVDPRDPTSFLPKVAEFNRQFPSARAIHVDHFNFVGLFTAYHEWSWRFVGTSATNPLVELYRVQSGEKSFLIVDHRDRPFFNLGLGSLYHDLASGWNDGGDRCQTVFYAARLTREAFQPGFRELPEEERLAKLSRLAAAEGLEARRVVLSGPDVFAELCADSAIRLSEIVPSSTQAGVFFQVQPDGQSALSVFGGGFQPGAIATLGGRALKTTFGDRGWVTAVVPRELYARPGRLDLRVTNPDGNSADAVFEVRP